MNTMRTLLIGIITLLPIIGKTYAAVEITAPTEVNWCKGDSVALSADVTNPTAPTKKCCKADGTSGGTWSVDSGQATTYKYSGDATNSSLDTSSEGAKTVTVTATIHWKCTDGTTTTTTETTSKTFCVVDPGTVPTSVTKITYKSSSMAPGSNWGVMAPKKAEWVLDVSAYFDCTSKKWKSKVTKAESGYGIGYHLISGVQEATVAAATAANYCKMKSDLAALGNVSNVQWYMVSAVKAHEEVHVQEWKDSLDPELAGAITTIEAIETNHTCGRTAAQAATAIKGQSSFTTAVNTAWNTAHTAFFAIPDPNAQTDAAELAVVNPRITAIQAHATTQGWTPCPP